MESVVSGVPVGAERHGLLLGQRARRMVVLHGHLVRRQPQSVSSPLGGERGLILPGTQPPPPAPLLDTADQALARSAPTTLESNPPSFAPSVHPCECTAYAQLVG